MSSLRHVCINCGSNGDDEGCIHNGSWHDKYSDCGVTCAWKLGWENLGHQHYSCCYATDREGKCNTQHHVYDALDVAPLANDGMFSTSDCQRFIVNLDQPPCERWNHIIKEYIHHFEGVISAIDTILGEGVIANISTSVFSGLNSIGKIYYNEELQGISKSSGISIGKISLLQIAYEVFAACTSIVVNMEQPDGRVCPYHIRTMDWEMNMLEALTIEVDFVRHGATVFTATTWAGYVGVLTGMKPDVGSVSVNYRRTFEGDRNILRGVIQNMIAGLGSAWPVSFLVREALDRSTSYEELVGALECSVLMAPTYIIVSGVLQDEGCVITRDRKESLAKLNLGMAGVDGIVQVNMDHFNLARGDDYDWQDICYSRYRHFVATRALESMQNTTPLDLWALLSVRPCLASDTVYTVAMCAYSGTIVSRVKVTQAHKNIGKQKWGELIRIAKRDFGR